MKKKIKKVNFNIKFICIFSIVILFLLTFLNYNISIFYNFFGYIVSPGQKLFSGISYKISDFSENFRKKQELLKEINNLKSEINNLRDQLIDYNKLKNENQKFIKYYDLKLENENLKFVPASIIGTNSLSLFGDFTIDKGSNSGISKNNVVMTENGVVGTVTSVGSSCSKVQTLLSPNIKLGAINIQNNETGIIMGFPKIINNNITRMIYISPQSNTNSGDIIVTSGISGLYPKNLKIGKVKTIEYDNTECYYYATIEIFENLNKIQDVTVITNF